MTPETAAFLSAADEALADAQRILEIDIPRQAARLAYYAQFHAAQAFIFEGTGTTSKTHKGVDKQFHKLTKFDQRLPSGLARDLSSAYRFKEVADYDVAGAAKITRRDAEAVIVVAQAFVVAIRNALTQPPGATAG
jgi:uncharacterized protein (UPF0332 family)